LTENYPASLFEVYHRWRIFKSISNTSARRMAGSKLGCRWSVYDFSTVRDPLHNYACAPLCAKPSIL